MDLSEYPAQYETSGIDWLTLVWPGGTLDEDARATATEVVQEQTDAGNEVKTWQSMGYRGVAVRGIRWGKRADSELLQLSGSVARLCGMRMLRTSGRPSRVDVQCTLRLNSSISSFGCCAIYGTSTPIQRLSTRVKKSHTQNTAGLWLGNIGSRTSERYVRVYDKGVEEATDSPGVRWRAEVEFKGALSRLVCKHLLREGDSAKVSCSLVQQSLARHGGQWPSFGRLVPMQDGCKKPREIADADRALLYLRKYCRKMARIAAEHRGVPAVLDALGLRK